VQILVVAANIQARTLKAEVEKGFARTAFDRELVVPKTKINLVNWTIGHQQWCPSQKVLYMSKGNQA